MPWKVSTDMSEREELVARYRQGESMTILARAYGIARKTGYKWVQRAAASEPLTDRSRRPASSPTRTAATVEQQVVDLRRAHPTWGGRKLHHRLAALGYGKSRAVELFGPTDPRCGNHPPNPLPPRKVEPWADRPLRGS
jgi:transposase-like protein